MLIVLKLRRHNLNQIIWIPINIWILMERSGKPEAQWFREIKDNADIYAHARSERRHARCALWEFPGTMHFTNFTASDSGTEVFTHVNKYCISVGISSISLDVYPYISIYPYIFSDTYLKYLWYLLIDKYLTLIWNNKSLHWSSWNMYMYIVNFFNSNVFWDKKFRKI